MAKELTQKDGAFSVYFRPSLNTKEATMEFWTSHGFHNVSEADVFINFFNGKDLNGTQIHANLSPKSVEKAKQLQIFTAPVQPLRTIRIFLPRDMNITERFLFEEFRHLGFIRNVEIIRNFAYIRFDTIEDASHAIKVIHKYLIQNVELSADIVEDFPMNFPPVVIPLFPVSHGCHPVSINA